jgi:hypothetical protein
MFGNILIALQKEIQLILKSKKIVGSFIKGFNLFLGSASKSNFWQYFTCVIKGKFFDFEIHQTSFLIKVLIYY